MVEKGKRIVAKTPTFLRKVLDIGDTRALALGRVIPQNWEWVQIILESKDEHCILLRIYGYKKGEIDAPAFKHDQEHKQNA